MNNKSNKGFTLVEIMIVVVIIGLLAMMAIPVFSKAREQSHEKRITENLRMIAKVGRQYILEEGVAEVGYTVLEGDDYIEPIEPVVDETYDDIVVSEDGGTISTKTSKGLEVDFAY